VLNTITELFINVQQMLGGENEMQVKLMAFTIGVNGETVEQIDAKAMMGCQSKTAAVDLECDEMKAKKMVNQALDLGHLSVLEHTCFTFSVRDVSRACTHQLVRHRLASYSQSSGRSRDWSKLSPSDFIMPSTIPDSAMSDVLRHYLECVRLYTRLVKLGVPGEDARFVMPTATPQNIVITMNARELLHFFSVRLNKAAQWEIREMAGLMLAIVKPLAPNIFAKAGEYKC
jgi:thymidylate synthase (FAD)